MSREFTREAVMKFLPAPFSWIWCKCLLRNLIHSKIFNLTKYREVLVKYSLLITHADLTPVTGTTNGFIFQIINLLIESWGYAWPVFCKFHAPALWNERTQHKNVLFLNLDTVFSDPENFANIWQIEGNWIRSMKFETVRIHLLNDVFGLLSSRNFATMATWRNDFSFLYNILVTLLNVLICTRDTVSRN